MVASELPDCDELFLKFFDPWYDDAWRKWRGFRGTRPDLMQRDGYVGASGAIASPLDEDGQAEAADMCTQMFKAAQNDWRKYLDVKPPVDLEWVSAFDRYYDRPQIASLIEESDPEDFGNSYLVTCCEFGSVLGEVLRSYVPSLEWVYAWPYWESSLLHPSTGTLVAVFDWAIKKMSEYGVDDGFAAKIKACSQILEKGDTL